MPVIKIGSKVIINQYNKDLSMNGRIGIVMKIGIHPDTSCTVKVGYVLLRFKGLKNLRLIEKKKYDIDLDNMSDKDVLSEILKILITMNNKIYKKIDAIFLYYYYIRIFIINITIFYNPVTKQTNKQTNKQTSAECQEVLLEIKEMIGLALRGLEMRVLIYQNVPVRGKTLLMRN